MTRPTAHMTFQAQQDAIFRNDLRAAYLRADAVGISGTLRCSELSGKEEDFYIDLAISGTKPLDGSLKGCILKLPFLLWNADRRVRHTACSACWRPRPCC